MENDPQIEDLNLPKQLSGINYEHNINESFKSKFFKFCARMMRLKDMKIIQEKLNGKPVKEGPQEPPKSFFKKFEVTSWQVEGRNVFKIASKNGRTKKQILFLHGGAYVMGIASFHWDFIQVLINQTGCTIIVPAYPLAPTYTYIDSYRFITPIYKSMILEVSPSDIIIMGDSAGGGFSLGLAQKIKEDGLQQPAQIILLAPWLDMTCSNPEMNEIDQNDPLISLKVLKEVAKAYTKGGNINNYLVSPINGNMEGLGKISLFISTYDILWADAKKFKTICNQKGIVINYYVYPKMMHDWIIFDLPESNIAVQQIKDLIKEK